MHMAAEPCDALVLGADERTGLATARSLTRGGVRVLGGGLDPRGFGFRSRSLRARVVYPNPQHDLAGFGRSVGDAALRPGVRVIFPCMDTPVMALNELRGELNGAAALALAPPKAVEVSLDKVRLQEIAASVDVETPPSYDVDGGPSAVPTDLPLPLIVKQRSSARRGPKKIRYCGSREELIEAIGIYNDAGHDALVQELICGYGVTVIALCSKGEVLQSLAYRRNREYSCRGGLGTLMESEPVGSALFDRSARLLRALGWEGIVGVEFKVPPDRPDRPVFLELNPRFPGPMELATAAGINFPVLHYHQLLGEEVPGRQIPYRSGVRYHRWVMDTYALIELWLDRPEVTGVPLPSRGRAVWDYMAGYGPGVRSDSFQLLDPLPGLVELSREVPEIARRLLRAVKKRLAGSR
jgi:predicted ATP-grasp superfamily ATP-dependent carboligase